MLNRSVQALKRILEADSTIAYVYTLVLKNDTVYFVLDPAQSDDKNGDGVDDKSHIMQEYPESSPLVVLALKKHLRIAEKELYQERWGEQILQLC